MTFEEAYNIINQEIAKRKSRWNLAALGWMDFDDVSQIIRIHIHKKWDKYDSKKPFLPWVNKVITSQIRNLIRNNYSNYARPCLKCPAAQGDNLCSIYGEQCSACPMYAQWMARKKTAYDVKLPVTLEYHMQEAKQYKDSSFDISAASENLHKYMKTILKPNEWIVYEHLYINQYPPNELPAKLGFKTTETNKSPGYKQIRNIQNRILLKAKKAIHDSDIDIL